ncbi:unnamed protein product [Didymodactylos carnosus]|nr:unnamed protein product [Didymodactylos carnosus]CAF4313106.1 unnamed protein product [Didymodactylos carnosus]
MDQAFDYIRINKGIDIEKSYPYEAQDGKCRFKQENVGANDTGYVDITKGNESDLKTAVATIEPISVGIDASVIVGYGTTDQKQDYYIVKNSYGTSWSDEGYILMSRNKNNQCGIVSMASYPLV